MSERFVRVFQPAGPVEIAQVRMALDGSGIPYFLDNEHYMTATGVPFALGVMQVSVLVPEELAEEATELLRDWFDVEGGPEGADSGPAA